MRGDVALTARLLLRREARPGLGMALGGATMAAATLLPWNETLTRVSMLGVTDERVTSTLRGVPGEPRAWVVAGLGVLCLVAGLGVAVDRPRARPAPLAAAASIAAVLASWALLAVGPAPGEPDGSGHLDLTADLPVGVEVVVVTVPGPGPWLAVLGAALALVGAAATRQE